MRARLVIKDITISRLGEVHYFTIRLPKNAIRIIGVETDVILLSPLQGKTPPRDVTANGKEPGAHEPGAATFLRWAEKSNPTMGKLKLKSADRSGLFFECWVPFIMLNASMPDMGQGLYALSPYTVQVKTQPRRMDIPCSHTMINACFTDSIGARRRADMQYIVKVMVWVETSEANQGVRYEFEHNKQTLELKE